jgi:hypothetical protein
MIGEGCTKVAEHVDVQESFELPINLESGDQHYLVCTLALHYGTCKCGGCVATEVVVSTPVGGSVLRNDHYEVATPDEVAEMFELAQKIDQEELRNWFA